MKTILSLGILLMLISCGGGGGGGSSSTPSVDAHTADSPETKEKEKQLQCLEEALGWIEAPPANKEEAMKTMSSESFESCASSQILDLYIERVMLAHPDHF